MTAQKAKQADEDAAKAHEAKQAQDAEEGRAKAQSPRRGRRAEPELVYTTVSFDENGKKV